MTFRPCAKVDVSTVVPRLVLICFLAAIVAHNPSVLADEVEKNIALDFFKSAERAELLDNEISLSGVDDLVQIVSDRPFHKVSFMKLSEFVANWQTLIESVEIEEPNAAITGMSNGERVALIAKLSNPRLGDGKLNFSFEKVAGDDVSQLSPAWIVIDNHMAPVGCKACHDD